MGFWNRLAIVGTVLAVLIAPLTLMVLLFKDIGSGVGASFKNCMENADDARVHQGPDPTELCFEQMSAGYTRADDAAYSWGTWFEFATGTLVICAILYALIWAGAAAVRWVLKGREVTKKGPAEARP